jgi:hypothetical protein
MRGTALCHSLCGETKKGALIDRQSLSIPLRGRALCEAWAEYCLQFLPGTSPIFWQIYFICPCLQRQLTERRVVFLAIYHCSVKIIGRSKGKSVIAAAAYRAGEKLCDRLDSCSMQDMHIIKDVVKAVKVSLNKYRDSY